MSKNLQNNKMNISNFIFFFHLIFTLHFHASFSFPFTQFFIYLLPFSSTQEHSEQNNCVWNYFKSGSFRALFCRSACGFLLRCLFNVWYCISIALSNVRSVVFDYVTFAVALVLAVDPLTSLLMLLTIKAVPLLLPLLRLLPPLLPPHFPHCFLCHWS